jgi:phosphoserine aminotransferase
MAVADLDLLSVFYGRQRPVHNFSGGPGALPDEVLQQAQEALGRAPGSELSVLGIGHRTAWFRDVLDEAEENIRVLLGLPADYEVLFLQGGASLQFSMVPMAMLRGRQSPADYIVSGYWSAKAVPEARREGQVRLLWSGEHEAFSRLPADPELAYASNAAYLHYVSNETVEGLQFHRTLGRDDVPRVCDMSSDFLSRPIDASRFALIYAHAQKNLGPAGVTLVVVRRDVLQGIPDDVPSMLDYRKHVDLGSIYNTPPVFAIYVTVLVTRWLRSQPGGLLGMAARNAAKARLLYSHLDTSTGFYQGRAAFADRSTMNVAFNLPTRELEQAFLKEAEDAGLYGLEGHRSCGGVRASLYNAVTLEAVQALCRFMGDFQARH